MSVVAWNVMLFLLSYFESWLCYNFLFSTVMRSEELQTRDKVVVQGGILFNAIISSVNRKMIFFSHMLFGFTLLITTICACYVYKKKKKYIFMVVTLYYSIVALLDFFFAYMCIEYVEEKFAQIIFWDSHSWWNIGIYLFSRIIMLCIYVILPKNKYKLEEMRIELGGVCIILIFVLRYYQINMAGMAIGEYPLEGVRMGKSLMVVLIVTLIGLLLVVKNRMIQRENEYLIMRDNLLMQTYCRIEDEIEQNRILIHDIKHEFILLNEYARREDIVSIKKYLNEVVENYDMKKQNVWTQEKIWDSVILQKKEEAERKGILVDVNAMMISEFPFNEREGCSIFGNLLDNAIEACEKILNNERWININIQRHGMLTFIEISNSAEEKLKFKNTNLDTTKENKLYHGYGLKSVKRIVDKYDGMMEYHLKDNIFTIRLSFFDIENNKEEDYGRKNEC